MTKAMYEAIDLFQSGRVIVVGDIMLDQYQWGSVERISPEAPVPVVSIDKTTCLLGGAGNVARNIKALGGTPWLLSVCGQDSNGQQLRDILEKQEIESCLLTDNQRQTTLKTRVIAGGQHVVRVDQESLASITGKVEEAVCEHLKTEVRKNDIVVVSDYGKGVLTPALQTCLNSLVQKRSCRILIDPKPANFPLYPKAFIMTPNRKETMAASGILPKNEQDIRRAGQKLIAGYGLENLLVTLGAKGMLLLQGEEKAYHIPTIAQQVFDVTGAGDTVIATLATALASGLDLLKSCILANYAAGFAVGQLGATAVTAAELKDWIHKTPPPELNVWG